MESLTSPSHNILLRKILYSYPRCPPPTPPHCGVCTEECSTKQTWPTPHRIRLHLLRLYLAVHIITQMVLRQERMPCLTVRLLSLILHLTATSIISSTESLITACIRIIYICGSSETENI